jgi:hypothetical protein
MIRIHEVDFNVIVTAAAPIVKRGLPAGRTGGPLALSARAHRAVVAAVTDGHCLVRWTTAAKTFDCALTGGWVHVHPALLEAVQYVAGAWWYAEVDTDRSALVGAEPHYRSRLAVDEPPVTWPVDKAEDFVTDEHKLVECRILDKVFTEWSTKTVLGGLAGDSSILRRSESMSELPDTTGKGEFLWFRTGPDADNRKHWTCFRRSLVQDVLRPLPKGQGVKVFLVPADPYAPVIFKRDESDDAEYLGVVMPLRP